jgi:uncharacterized integral membrane protein (TIGR00698 family)
VNQLAITTAIPTLPRGWRGAVAHLPGVALAGALAAAAISAAANPWFQSRGISALTLSIVLGMCVGNTLYPRISSSTGRGVTFSKQSLLRLGIILYGLRLTFQDIAHVGVAGVLIDSIVLCSTFTLSWWVGTRVFGLDRKTAMLIGAGSSICGAAAVMATEPVVRGRAEQVAVAISTVVAFGTLAIFVYPALFHLVARYHMLAMSPHAYGLFAGSTVHEVAQVVAAGRAISEGAANAAVITKMVRVMMLAPFLVILSAYLSRIAKKCDAQVPGGDQAWDDEQASGGGRPAGRIIIPWFAVGFVGVAALNSLGVLPKTVVSDGVGVDTVILAMAMAALGLTTHVSALRTAGIKPLALGALLFAWLIVGGFAINAGICALLG